MPRTPSPQVHGAKVFDAHCHVLNLDYLLYEAVQILYDMVRGTYPLGGADPLAHVEPMVPDFEIASPLEQAEGFLAWSMQIGRAAFRSEAANVDELRRAAAKAWGVTDLSMTPLMMDIYYMFSPPLAPEGWVPQTVERSSLRRRTHVKALSARVASIVRGVRERMADGDTRPTSPGGAIEKRVWSVVERVLSESRASVRIPAPGFARTAGFARQFRDIIALGAADPGVRPFFAVDPRRPGAVDWVIRSGMVGPEGPFYGVKLYPRLGAHPASAPLAPLFRFCAERGIPITTHTSHRGFPDWMSVYAEFGSPASFSTVLAANPKLRIDFAHFGDRPSWKGPGEDWGMRIATLMEDYEGVYSDLSCYTHDSALDKWQTDYAPLPHVQDRTMFGSDFNVLFFTEPGMTLERYYRRFLERFPGDTLDRMASEIPARFLGM